MVTNEESGIACPDLGREAASASIAACNESMVLQQKLTVKEAAKAMGIGATSLRRLINQGAIPILRITNTVLILASDVESFMRNARVTVHAVRQQRTGLPGLPLAVLQSDHLR